MGAFGALALLVCFDKIDTRGSSSKTALGLRAYMSVLLSNKNKSRKVLQNFEHASDITKGDCTLLRKE